MDWPTWARLREALMLALGWQGGAGVGVAVGGNGVAVGGTGVSVGVRVGVGKGVAVGGMGVGGASISILWSVLPVKPWSSVIYNLTR